MKKLIYNVKKFLKLLLSKNRYVHKFYIMWMSSKHKENFGLRYKPDDINGSYYNKIKNLGYSELEHQIGRFVNFKEIINDCDKLKGDFVEFGVWRGFSMLWISYFMERSAIFNRKIIGLDGFVGLPYSDGIFLKYGFSDTSLKICQKNLYENNILYPETKKNILIAKYLYKEKNDILSYLKSNEVNKFCFIHIDCDVTKSFLEIMDILIDGDLIANEAFLLFDDYGCESGLRITVDSYINKLSDLWYVEEHSSTKMTKNYYLKRK